MNIVVFASGTGSNFQALINEQARLGADSPFQIKALFCDRVCAALEIAEIHQIPVILSSSRDFRCRESYDQKTIELIEPFQADLIVLAGYMKIVHHPLLAAYPDRMINVHPADLTVLDEDGGRRYIGLDGVGMALEAKEKRTRSSVLLVNEQMDGGPILVSGPWVDVIGDSREEHQQRQKKESDWPALTSAVNLIAEGRLAKDRENAIYLDGQRLGYDGVRELCAV